MSKSIENFNVQEMKDLLEYIKHMNGGYYYQDFDYYNRTQTGTGYVEFVLRNKGEQVTFDLGDDMNTLIRKFVLLDIPRHNIADFKLHATRENTDDR